MTRFLREAKRPPSSLLITFSQRNPGFDDSDEVIFLALADQPLASIHRQQERPKGRKVSTNCADIWPI
jgi:hypothetical protein